MIGSTVCPEAKTGKNSDLLANPPSSAISNRNPSRKTVTYITFHDLRHYLASLLIASSADIKTVQARMRHATARITLDSYGQLWPDADESTRSAVGAVIAKRMDSLGASAD